MKKIIHVATIKKPSAQVFRSLTTQQGLSSWWSTEVKADEARVGGIVHFTFGGDFNPDMKNVGLDGPTLLRWRCVGGHDNWRENEFEFRLSQSEGVTQLMFLQDYSRELDDVQYGIYNFNWGYYLGSLVQYCEEGKGRPFDPSMPQK